jgi:hypothetical protein
MADADSGEATALADDTGRVAAALRTLDPFSFWVVPTAAGQLIVAGTTGVFLVAPVGGAGVATAGSTGLSVSGSRIKGIRKVRGAAKKVEASMVRASVHASVEPVVCLTEALAGPPQTIRGIRYASVRDIAADLAGRSSALSRGRAQRAARALGMQIAGDQHRHFSPS